jgi:hypothetical protein
MDAYSVRATYIGGRVWERNSINYQSKKGGNFIQVQKVWSMNLAMLCVAVMLIAGCGGGGSSTPSTPAATTGSLSIANNSSSQIDEVDLSLHSSSSWGSQRNSSVILAGYIWTLSGIPPDIYDTRAISNGAVIPIPVRNANNSIRSW